MNVTILDAQHQQLKRCLISLPLSVCSKIWDQLVLCLLTNHWKLQATFLAVKPLALEHKYVVLSHWVIWVLFQKRWARQTKAWKITLLKCKRSNCLFHFPLKNLYRPVINAPSPRYIANATMIFIASRSK